MAKIYWMLRGRSGSRRTWGCVGRSVLDGAPAAELRAKCQVRNGQNCSDCDAEINNRRHGSNCSCLSIKHSVARFSDSSSLPPLP